ncbi:MAG: hypothetical protein Q9162_004650 [Coniocarpon cinnabarinum]
MSTPVPKFPSFKRPIQTESEQHGLDTADRGARKQRRRPDDQPLQSPTLELSRQARRSEKKGPVSSERRAPSRSVCPPRRRDPNDIGDVVKDSGQHWKVDTSGDSGIIQFGVSDHSKVPKYRLYTRRCLGLPARETHQEIPNKMPGLSQYDAGKLNKDTQFLTESDLKMSAADVVGSDFVSLSVLGKRKRKAPSRSQSPLSSGSVITPLPDNCSSDSDVSDNGMGTTTPDHSLFLRQKLHTLQGRTQLSPREPFPWVDLARFQDEWVSNGLHAADGNEHGMSSRVSGTVCRLKIAILEEGLKQVARYAAENLLLEIMPEYVAVLNQQDLLQKWKSLSGAHLDAHRFWIKYLRFIQFEARCSFEACQAEYVRYLQHLCQSVTDGETSNRILEVFSLYTSFHFQAGYTERAVAMWQAMLEIQVFRPASLSTPDNKPINIQALSKAFESFWQSKALRVGEKGALGWTHSESNSGQPLAEVSQRTEAPVSSISEWAAQEQKTKADHFLPGRVTGEDGDPLHVVLFSDLEHCFQILALPFARHAVYNTFLSFCNLPPLAATTSNIFAKRTGPDQLFVASDDLLHRQRRLHTRPCLQAISTMLHNPDPTLEFACNAFEAIAAEVPSDRALVEQSILLDSMLSVKRARKFIKGLLKAHASDLWLYNQLARLEIRQNNLLETDRICSIALGTDPGDSNKYPNHECLLLRHTWAWSALRQARLEEALRRLIMANSVHSGPPEERETLIAFERVMERAIAAHQAPTDDSEGLALYFEILALLAYLPAHQTTSDAPECARPSLDRALQRYEQLFRNDDSLASIVVWQIHVRRAQLVDFHLSHYGRAFVPGVLRSLLDALHRSTDMYPQDLYFHEVLHKILPATDRIRALLPSAGARLREPSTLTKWATSIYHEMQRSSDRSGTQTVVRRQFERATASEHGKHCPVLWAWWMRWEFSVVRDQLKQKDQWPEAERCATERCRQSLSRVHEVWLRGWQALPLVVDWPVLAFKTLGDFMEAIEVRAIFESVEMRGLRLGLDPVLLGLF